MPRKLFLVQAGDYTYLYCPARAPATPEAVKQELVERLYPRREKQDAAVAALLERTTVRELPQVRKDLFVLDDSPS